MGRYDSPAVINEYLKIQQITHDPESSSETIFCINQDYATDVGS